MALSAVGIKKVSMLIFGILNAKTVRYDDKHVDSGA